MKAGAAAGRCGCSRRPPHPDRRHESTSTAYLLTAPVVLEPMASAGWLLVKGPRFQPYLVAEGAAHTPACRAPTCPTKPRLQPHGNLVGTAAARRACGEAVHDRAASRCPSFTEFKNQNEVNHLPLELSADEVTLAAQQGGGGGKGGGGRGAMGREYNRGAAQSGVVGLRRRSTWWHGGLGMLSQGAGGWGKGKPTAGV